MANLSASTLSHARRIAGAVIIAGLAAAFGQGAEVAMASQTADTDPGIVTPEKQAYAAAASLMAPTPVSSKATYTLLGPGSGPAKGADIDGDGRADFANPTGQGPRGEDAYGSGAFGAVRTGHIHAGVDYVASAGQAVYAPIAGMVTRIGYPYRDDANFRYVEITNPSTGYVARVMYVGPQVNEGERVDLGEPIGRAQTLQRRYPLGITNHVHLELARSHRNLDATTLIPARG